MANTGQPTIASGATGSAVRRLQRAIRRTPAPGFLVDGIFGPMTDQVVREFQDGAGLTVDGIVGPLTWAALPDGGPMPLLQQGSTGAVVERLQEVLTNGASEGWPAPGPIDGDFGPLTRASVVGFQTWAEVAADGIVGDNTWGASLHALSATLESVVGLNFVLP